MGSRFRNSCYQDAPFITNPKELNNLGKFLTKQKMMFTVKSDTAFSFAFNQMHKLLVFKFQKIVISFVRKTSC